MQALAGELVNVLREAGQIVPAALMKFGTHVKKKVGILYLSVHVHILLLAQVMLNVLNHQCHIVMLQESKLYGAHFKEIVADGPKSTKITFNDSDDED